MAAQTLSSVRLKLIERVNDALLKDLIDGLRDKDPPVLTGREANEILQGHKVTEDKTGQLVDMVYKKGNKASNFMFDILKEKAPEIAEFLKLSQDQPDGRRMTINDGNMR